jgi:hypothetical protein
MPFSAGQEDREQDAGDQQSPESDEPQEHQRRRVTAEAGHSALAYGT